MPKSVMEQLLETFGSRGAVVQFLDLDGKVFHASTAWERLLGYQAGEMERRNFASLIADEDRGRWEAALQRALTSPGPVALEVKLINRDGREVFTGGSVGKFTDGGGKESFALTLQDISGETYALAEVNEFFKISLNLLTISDVQGHVIRGNPAWETVLGYNPDEVNGRNFMGLVHPEDLPAVLSSLEGIQAGGPVRNFLSRTRARDGSYRWMESQAVLSRDTGLIYAESRDVTEKLAREAELERLRNLYDQILQSAAEGIVGIDTIGRFTFANAGAYRLLGFSHGELTGKFAHGLVHHHREDGSEYPWGECSLLSAMQGNAVERGQQDTFWRKDGTAFPVEHTCMPMYEDGEVSGVVVVFRDVTLDWEAERLRREEISRAAAIQQGLMPKTLPEVPGYTFGAVCLPASEVGGDFFDWRLNEDGRYDFMVCDVMGKGLPAALIMTTVRAALRSAGMRLSPEEVVNSVLRAIGGDLEASDAFVTLFYGELDPATGTVRYVDAGHGLTFLHRVQGTVEALDVRGLPLGVDLSYQYRQGVVQLDPGDMLVVYTDGLTEPQSTDPVTPDALSDLLQGQLVGRTLTQNMGRGLPHLPGEDDVTLLVLQADAPAAAE